MALVVLALIGSLLALAVPPTMVAGAQDPPPGNTTTTTFDMDCLGRAAGFAQPQTEAQSFDVTAPAQVEPGASFTIRIATNEAVFPRTQDTVAGLVTIFGLQNLKLMYNLPTNSTVQSVSIVEGSGQGFTGPATVAVDNSFSPARIVLSVPAVPGNPTPPTLETFFQLPAIDVEVTATGPVGSNVSTRIAGFNDPTAGYTFIADNSVANAQVRCWPAGEVPGPLMSQTAIATGGASTPTTTTLSVDPTVLPGGNEATMVATVTAPSGVVRFNDGATSLGLAELNEEGVASLVAPLNNVGARQITATFLGSPGFETSTSTPVAVAVTNPANRVPSQITVGAAPNPVNLSATNGNSTVTVSVDPTNGSITPTGSVRLYVNDQLVGNLALVDGVASQQVTVQNTGNTVRVEYLGDTEYFSSQGTLSIPGLGATSAYPTGSRPLSGGGAWTLNGAEGSLPASSVLNSSYRVDADGFQDLDGVLSFPATTFNLAGGGTLWARLVQVGWAQGGIEPGVDAAAELSGQFALHVTAADFADGSGQQLFGSTCQVGPFPLHFEGERAALGGPLTLSDANFLVPPTSPGSSCTTESGASRAAQVSTALAGAVTQIGFTMTPPEPVATQITSQVTISPAGGASFGQPTTLTATVTRVDGLNWALLSAGFVEFYVNGEFHASQGLPNAAASPTRTATVIVPGSFPALPQGTLDITARFVASDGQKWNWATSAFSPSTSYTVLPPIEKGTPELTLEVPDTASVAEAVTLTVSMDPAPSEAPGVADLAGTITIYDRDEPGLNQAIPTTASASGTINVSSASSGVYEAQIALASGVHSLEAVFVPSIESAWGWNPASSGMQAHTVVGEQIPTQLTIVSDSTRGTGEVPVGAAPRVEVQIEPKVVASTAPYPARLNYLNPATGDVLSTNFDTRGRATVPILGAYVATVGPAAVPFWFDPFQYTEGGLPRNVGNRGFAPSEVVFEFDVVDAAQVGPLVTGIEIAAAAPNRTANPPVLVASEPIPANTPWGLDGYVSYRGTGNPNGGKVDYIARNTATAEITQLGAAGVRPGTGAADQGRASIPSSAQSGFPAVGEAPGLPAGTYEVIGTYTPNSPSLYQPATSEPFFVTVLADGETIDTETTLSVTPSGTSEPGEPVLLEAHVTPGEAVGEVEFFDGGDSLGTAPLAGGYASLMVFDLEPGEHQLSAVFESSSPLVEDSSSDLVPHLVADPAILTETVLTIEPEGSSLEGEDVTLTASVSGEDPESEIGGPSGTVVFEDEHGEIGSAPVVDGVAVLVTDELESGTHEVVAVFQPDPESDFAESVSEAVTHEVVAQNEPQPPLDVTALGGGLMATVSWDVPEDDGGQPITGYTVYVSSGEEPEEWDFPVADVTAAVTTVDVIGLEADVDYSFKVSAWNSIGESELSEVSNTVTVGGPTYEFTDMAPGDDFFNEITWMAEVGLSTGFEPGPEYRPGATLTRQAMSAFIYRLNGSPLGSDPQCESAPFPDVSVDNDFCGEIAWMKAEGITTGNEDGTFNPTGGLSRQAMSAFLYRSANGDATPLECEVAPFPDVPVTNQFCPQITWMADTGISTGFEDGEYKPFQDLTRRAMSAFLYRYTLVVQTTIV